MVDANCQIRPEIQALIDRGRVTLAEYMSLRCNSYEWEAIVPALDDRAFFAALRHCLDNCSQIARPAASYDEAAIAVYLPDLKRRYLRAVCSEHADCVETPALGYACKQRGKYHANDNTDT